MDLSLIPIIILKPPHTVPVFAESKHCEDYLKILLLRYPDKFTYYIEVHDEVADAEIFPFLIQV